MPTTPTTPDDRSSSPRSSGTTVTVRPTRLWSGQPNAQLAAQVADLARARRWRPGAARAPTPSGWPGAAGPSPRWTCRPSPSSGPRPRRAGGRRRGAADHLAARGPAHLGPGAGAVRPGVGAVHALARAELAAFHPGWRRRSGPGGTLLLVAHHPDDMHAQRKGRPDLFWYAEDIAASPRSRASGRSGGGSGGRSANDLDGQPMMVRDTVLRAARRR